MFNSNKEEKSLIIRKETVFDKIRRSLMILIYQKDYKIIQEYEELFTIKKPDKKIIIPKEIRY